MLESKGNTGDDDLAVNAKLNEPPGLAINSEWIMYIADNGYSRFRQVNLMSGIITKFAGGTYGTGVSVSSNGDVFVSDYNEERIRRISTIDGKIYAYSNTKADGIQWMSNGDLYFCE